MDNFRASFFSRSYTATALWIAAAFFALGALFLFSGWDYSIQVIIAENDVHAINKIWRGISLFSLGKIQALFCLLAIHWYVGRNYTFLAFLRFICTQIIRIYLNLWRNAAQLPKNTHAWPAPAKALLSAIPITFAAGTVCAILKMIIGRPRPKMQLWYDETAFQFFDGFSGRYQSLPSGHVMTTVALLTIIWPHFPRLRWLFLAYGTLSATARVMSMTTHYISDVLIGASLGIVVALLFNHQLNKPAKS